jgi:AraC family transcriptional regulator
MDSKEQEPSVDVSGETLRLREVGPFTLRENFYPSGLVLSKHSHERAYITFVIEGIISERYATRTVVCRTGMVRYLPAGETHENVIQARSRCLHISAEASAFEQLRQSPDVPRKPVEINGLNTTWLANRLYAEFSRQDTASSMAIEGLVLEILAEVARAETADASLLAPHWLKHATEIVESRFLERLSLTEIASQVGVHYVHLSRQFHKYNRCTVGELIRRRRVQYASYLLAHSRTPLAEIALTCGFSDQSHLSFLFKRYMGLSPSKFRGLAGIGLEAKPVTETWRGMGLRTVAGPVAVK